MGSVYPTSVFLVISSASVALLLLFINDISSFETFMARPIDILRVAVGSGAESLVLGIILSHLYVVYLELRSVFKKGARSAESFPIRLTFVFVYSFVILLVAGLTLVGIFEVNQTGVVMFYFIFPFLAAICLLAVAWTILWVVRNPNARLHNNLGVERLAKVSLLHGLVWIPWLMPRFRSPLFFNTALDICFLAAQCIAISLVTWLGVNALGWILEGFGKKSSP